MASIQELNQVREALATYFSGLSDYLSGVSSMEPSLDSLATSITLDESITEATNNSNRYSGYKPGALSEAIDRVSSILKEITLVQASSSALYTSMLNDVDGDSSNWQTFIYRTLNYMDGKDPSQ